jgi:predicted S18 family serine protease
MNKYFAYYEKDPVHIERESLHREIRRMLNEGNFPECHRAYLQLIEDLYLSTVELNLMYEVMSVAASAIGGDQLSNCAEMAAKAEKRLEVWEQHLLRESFCSGESCF